MEIRESKFNVSDLSVYFNNAAIPNRNDITYIPLHDHNQILKVCKFLVSYKKSALYNYLLENKPKIVIFDGSNEYIWESKYTNFLYADKLEFNLEENILNICNDLGCTPIWLSPSSVRFENIKTVYQNGTLDTYLENNWDLNIEIKDYELEKHYLCLNRQIREHRTKLVNYLCKNQFEKGYISYNTTNEDIDNLPNDYKNYLLDFCNEEEKEFFLKQKPLILDSKNDEISIFMNKPHNQLDSRFFNQSFFSIVSETAFFDTAIFPTEKTWKIFNNCHLFVLFGMPGIVYYLRQCGFDVFDDVINHSYDLQIDHFTRAEMVFNEINRLCTMPLKDLELLKKSLKDRLMANKLHLYNFYKLETDRVRKEIYDFIC